jgi:hypothetical protein
MSAKTITLVGESQRDYARQYLDAVRLDPDEPVEVVFRKRIKKRTDPQRALFWVWMRAIRQHLLDSLGQPYSEQELHDWFCQKFLGVKEVTLRGITKYYTRGTSDLTKSEMREFLDQIDMYCASELDLFLPAGEGL